MAKKIILETECPHCKSELHLKVLPGEEEEFEVHPSIAKKGLKVVENENEETEKEKNPNQRGLFDNFFGGNK